MKGWHFEQMKLLVQTAQAVPGHHFQPGTYCRPLQQYRRRGQKAQAHPLIINRVTISVENTNRVADMMIRINLFCR